MPSIQHEAVVELLHRNPQLIPALLAACGVYVEADAAVTIADSNLSARKPIALTAEVVVEVTTSDGVKRVVVFEVQKDPPKLWKRRAWTAYVPIAGVQHRCDVHLVVIALSARTARASRKLIRTGHPGYDLTPIVIGPDNTPDPVSPRHAPAAMELTILALLTGALDLSLPPVQAFVVRMLAKTDPDSCAAYTGLILTIASEADQRTLEDLMFTATRRDNLADRLVAEGRVEGRVEGQAAMLLRILQTRGFAVTDEISEQVTACPDTALLEEWAARAVVAESITEVFAD
jgi:hypothetical protein